MRESESPHRRLAEVEHRMGELRSVEVLNGGLDVAERVRLDGLHREAKKLKKMIASS